VWKKKSKMAITAGQIKKKRTISGKIQCICVNLGSQHHYYEGKKIVNPILLQLGEVTEIKRKKNFIATIPKCQIQMTSFFF
jgi:hypothetical protein